MKCQKCQHENTDTARFCSNCAVALSVADVGQPSFTKTLVTPVDEFKRGTLFASRYEIIEELGAGGMGTVYRVEDKKINQEIALKLLKPEIAADKTTIERFRNELTLARKIRHKNICGLFDLNDDKGTLFITMEYVPGEDLKSFIKRSKQLSIPNAISLAKQVCDGLGEAHRLGVVHRDLKPSNIMIDKEGNVHIMDFGIARSLKTKGITDAAAIVGTAEYMSPEQAEAKEVDQRSDIYALGVVLYEMVTGELPFGGDTPLSIALKHKGNLPKNPKEINPHIPDELSYLIIKCLEKDKDRRYQSAEELHVELGKTEKDLTPADMIHLDRGPITNRPDGVRWIKNILYSGSVVALLILLIIAAINLFKGREEAIDSVAVLPFENADLDTAYLSDGITESLINKLSQLPNLKKVIARGSVFHFKGKKINPQEAGQELDVDAVLLGQMSHREDELSISVELIKVRDNRHIWGKRYKRKISEIFKLEEEISTSITDNLRLRLTSEQIRRMAKRYTENAEAYKEYLRGRYFWNKRTQESIEKSIDYFELAIDKDPAYALAYAGLADSYNTLGIWGGEPNILFSKAEAAALKALEIDDLLAEAHNALAGVKSDFIWDWQGAERGFKRAIELNPSYASAHQWYGEYLTYMGRFDEAIIEFNRALELDPLSLIINAVRGWVFYFMGEYELSIQECHKTLEMNSDFYPPYLYLGWNYIAKGLYKEALEASEKAIIHSDGNTLGVSSLIIAYAGLGMPKKAQEILDSLIDQTKQKYVSPFHLAMTFAALDEKDEAFEWLERAYGDHFIRVPLLRYGRWFDSLRSDPRYESLLKRMNLE